MLKCPVSRYYSGTYLEGLTSVKTVDVFADIATREPYNVSQNRQQQN
jgi:hypothetical protein